MTASKPLLSAADQEAVRAAVARAEEVTGAEIVPVVVPASEGHEMATWKGAALGAIAGALAAALAGGGVPRWGVAVDLLVLVPAGLVLGGLASRWAPLRRLLVGKAGLETTVEGAAWEAFVRHEVFATRDRTGLLLYVSMLEHEVAILADSGIHPQVPQAEWDALARAIAGEMKRRTPGEALLAALDRVAQVLSARGPARRADDRNELPDLPGYS